MQVKKKKEIEGSFLLVKVKPMLTMPMKNSKRRVSKLIRQKFLDLQGIINTF